MARRNICRFVSRSSRYESECCTMVFLQSVRKFENLCEHKSLCEKLEPQVHAVLRCSSQLSDGIVQHGAQQLRGSEDSPTMPHAHAARCRH
jgi:hypothetical protein